MKTSLAIAAAILALAVGSAFGASQAGQPEAASAQANALAKLREDVRAIKRAVGSAGTVRSRDQTVIGRVRAAQSQLERIEHLAFIVCRENVRRHSCSLDE